MTQESTEAVELFTQIEGMTGEQLAERGRIGQMQQRWSETPWCRRAHSLQDLAFATAEIFGLLQGKEGGAGAERSTAALILADLEGMSREDGATCECTILDNHI